MSTVNIPLTVLAQVNHVEKSSISGPLKKSRVVSEIKEILDDNIDTNKLISDLIDLLVDISKKQVKLAINKGKSMCLPLL